MQVQTITNFSCPGLAMLDRTFLVDRQVVLHMRGGVLTYEVAGVAAPYVKTYPSPTTFGDDTEGFIATEGSTILGQLTVSPHWTGFAAINDLAISSDARRKGVGSALVNAAKGWAVERGLPGLSVETQNNNVGACMLYAKAGFVLAGFDTHLYRSSERFKHEVALFWYWCREENLV